MNKGLEYGPQRDFEEWEAMDEDTKDLYEDKIVHYNSNGYALCGFIEAVTVITFAEREVTCEECLRKLK